MRASFYRSRAALRVAAFIAQAAACKPTLTALRPVSATYSARVPIAEIQYSYLNEHISAAQLQQLQWFADLLETEAMPAGFIGDCTRTDLELRHIFDSILPAIAPESRASLPLYQDSRLNVFDLGAGAGLPSLPLAILFPQHAFHLLDSQEKRCRFAEAAASKLGLTNVTVYHGVVQDFPKKYPTAPKADVVIFRAFRKILASLELSLHVLTERSTHGVTKVLYWRSQRVPFSDAGERRVEELGFQTESFVKFDSAADLLPRGLYTFTRTRPTAKQFPRSWKKIAADTLVETES